MAERLENRTEFSTMWLKMAGKLNTKVWVGLCVSAIFLFSLNPAWCQSSGILLRNAPSNTESGKPVLQLKWYDAKTVFKNVGYNIYRKDNEGSWQKLNALPLKRGSYSIPKSILLKDSSLTAYVDMINHIKPDSIQGFMLLSFLLKSFENKQFAQYVAAMYEDSDVQRSSAYQYKVMVLENSVEREIGVSRKVVCGNYQPMPPPKDVVIKPKKRRTEFSWTMETDNYYGVNIYRKASDSVAEKKLNQQPLMPSMRDDGSGKMKYADVLYTDKNLRENVTYTYRLTAMDYFGSETEFTPGIKAFIADSTAPLPPQNLRYELKKYSLSLSWDERTDPDVSGYYLYQSKKNKGPYERVNAQLMLPGQHSYQLESKEGDYYYYIAAVDKAGNEASSDRIYVHVHDITPPSPPQDLTVQPDSGRIFLQWKPNTEKDLMGYQVYRSIDYEDTTHFVLINAVILSAPLYVDSLAKNKKNKFMYKIVALDSSYNKSNPSLVKGARMPDVIPPEQPLIKSANMKNDDIVIAWIANVDDDLWGYNLYRRSEKDTAGFKQTNIHLLPGNSRHYTDRNTEAGQLYHYYLLAIDSSGNVSRPSETFVVRNAVSASASQLVTFNKANARFIKKSNRVHLSWQVEQEGLLGSVIYRKVKDENTMLPLTGMLTTQEYTDEAIEKAKTYIYEIRVYSSSGAVQRSSELMVETPHELKNK
jgi:hypothetical protein